MRFMLLLACALTAGFTPADEDVSGLTLERSKADGARLDAITVSHDQVRHGGTSIRFSIVPGDCTPDDCNADRERVELKSRDTEREGNRSTYQWSFHLPTDFKSIWPAREFIAQFHQEGGKPAMLFSLEADGLMFESRFLAGPKPVLIPRDALFGQWHDLEVAVDWSKTKGMVRIRVDGEERLARDMQTMSEEEAYFKIGLYRAHISRGGAMPEQVMHVDGIKRIQQ